MRVLIVEDECALAAVVKRHLEAGEHEVEIASDGGSGIAKAEEAGFDLLLLDLNLPDCDGMEVLRAVRRPEGAAAIAAIMVLSGRSRLEDRLKCFELGADDYLTKPFALRELTVRVQALLRRPQSAPAPILRCADLELNFHERSVARSGKRIDLSAREYALAEYLIQHKGRCVTRASLLTHVWGLPEESGTNVVEVYVNYLRRKVDQGFSNPLIHTVRGEGYVIREINTALSERRTGTESNPGFQRRKGDGRQSYPFPEERSA